MATPTLLKVSADENCKNNSVFQVAFDKAWKPDATASPTPSDDVINNSYALQLRNNVQGPPEQHPGGGKNPTSVARRNARERRRIRNVNSAFDELRQHVPNGERNRKKISKVDTLQSAIEYIKALEELVRSRRSKQGTNSTEEDKENVPTSPKINPKSPTQSEQEQADSEDIVFVKATQQAQVHEGSKQLAKKTTPPCAAAKKQPRPLELTESMLKAFDVMIQKCASDRKKSSEVGSKCEQENVSCLATSQISGGDCQLFSAPSEDASSSQIGCDSGFSEFFSKDEDFPAEQLNNLNINNIDINNNNVPRPRQSSVDSSSAIDPLSMDFSASPIFCGSDFGDQNHQQQTPHQGAFLSQLENFVPTLEVAASDPSFTSSIMNPVSSSWQQQPPLNPHHQLPASFQGGEMETGGYLASPCERNVQQSPDGSFPSSTSSVSTDLDSINPMFSFLSDPEERFLPEPTPYDGCYDYARIHGDHTSSFVQSLYIS